MVSRGGTLIMHGWTHQFDAVANPYNAVTGEDFEFYRAHIDGQDNVIYDGPVPVDAEAWAAQRMDNGLNEFQLARLPRPTIFEFPHYAGSAEDAWAVRRRFSTVYHRGLYFGGQLRGETPRYDRPIGVFFPFKGKDVFGFDVLPENLGGYHPEASNNHPPRLVADLVTTALANRVVRDGVASFYFHAYHPLSVLKQLVKGLRAAGYEFVAASAL
jgi:uncharacterized protein YdaL